MTNIMVARYRHAEHRPVQSPLLGTGSLCRLSALALQRRAWHEIYSSHSDTGTPRHIQPLLRKAGHDQIDIFRVAAVCQKDLTIAKKLIRV